MAVVYEHMTKDTGVVFYVGIGKSRKRAYSTSQRTIIWKNVVSKHGYIVKILHEDLTWEEACTKEKELIKLYGKRLTGTGTLINITDGGDGRLGAYPSEATRKKMSEAHKGKPSKYKGVKASEEKKQKIRNYFLIHGNPNKGKKRSKEQKRKISETLKKRPHNNWLGRKHSEESKLKMSLSHGSGSQNPRFGTKHKQETIEKMKEAVKNRDNTKYSRKKSQDEINRLKQKAMDRPKIVCPHCNKIGQHNLMIRWHFDNCKQKK